MFSTIRCSLLSCSIYLAIIGLGITIFKVEAAAGIVLHALPSLATETGGSVLDDTLVTGDEGRRLIVKVPHGRRGERVKRVLGEEEDKRGEKWCNQYFCLTATISLDASTESKDTSKTNDTTTQITYSLVSRSEQGALGWLAVGVGHQMMGGKMWVTWSDQAEGGGGGCVLSERDGTGYKPPTITKDPIAHLVPNLINTGASNTTATRPFECTWTVPTSKIAYFEGGRAGVDSRATPMDMIWAFSGTRPVVVQGDPSKDGSGAVVKMHSAFGTFAVDFTKRFEEEGGADKANAEDEAKEARRRMVIRAHAVVMVRPLPWIVDSRCRETEED
ncbi:hypothetical protein QFC22_006267 [Naganishia vaughanmartiniae]|uniref:Uncharacterized protein n=1 Tax=Naganishia vaughanmartiniae TaxID=1424756 RepID=A0ACC2WM89_9TREE|nr:hypothetical protein QFC22_006267 [Naganishia vaughanmartiniae]